MKDNKNKMKIKTKIDKKYLLISDLSIFELKKINLFV